MRERRYGHIEQSGQRTRAHFTVLELGVVSCGGLHAKEEQAEARRQTLVEQQPTAEVIFLRRGDVYTCDNRINTHGVDDGTHGSKLT